MQNLGERFEEARTRKGISIREASDSLKIRGDFLVSFEKNDFSINLPDIYKRGFLRNYAGYLEVDVSDVNLKSLIRGRAKSIRKETKAKPEREYYGSINVNEIDKIGEERREVTGEPEEKPLPSIGQQAKAKREEVAFESELRKPAATIKQEPVRVARKGLQPTQRMESAAQNDDSKSLYLKIAGAVGGLVVLILVVSIIISFLTGDDEDSSSPAIAGDTGAGSSIESSSPVVNNSLDVLPPEEELVVLASGPVFVMVRQEFNKEVLFRRQLSAGQKVPIRKRGMVQIYATEVKNILIQKGGKKYKMGESGSGSAKFN